MLIVKFFCLTKNGQKERSGLAKMLIYHLSHLIAVSESY